MKMGVLGERWSWETVLFDAKGFWCDLGLACVLLGHELQETLFREVMGLRPTSYSGSPEAHQGLAADQLGYLGKPLSLSELLVSSDVNSG